MNRVIRTLILAVAALTAAPLSAYSQTDTLRIRQVDSSAVAVVRTDTTVTTVQPDTVRIRQVDSSAVNVIRKDTLRTGRVDSSAVTDVRTDGDVKKESAVRESAARQAEAIQKVTRQTDADTTRTAIPDTARIVPPLTDTLMYGPMRRDSIPVVRMQADSTAVRDSLRRTKPAIGVNLAWAGIATPNISFEYPLNDHFSAGLSAGLKPRKYVYWPRWIPWDPDGENPAKWHHLAVIPYLRWWPKETFNGLFVGADLMYAHYNIGSIQLPLGIYPDIAEHRLQGDFFGAGLSLGYSAWITTHLNLVLSAGILGGYKYADKYECPTCGAKVGTVHGAEVVPKLDVSIAYHLFREKRKK